MLVFLLTQKDTAVDEPSDNDFYKTGCVAQIKQTLTKNQDGNIRVIAEGYCRAEVVKLKRDKDYITADVLSKTLTAETGVLDIRSEALINESLSTLEEVLQFHPTISSDYLTTASSITNPGLLAVSLRQVCSYAIRTRRRCLKCSTRLKDLRRPSFSWKAK